MGVSVHYQKLYVIVLHINCSILQDQNRRREMFKYDRLGLASSSYALLVNHCI